MTDLEKLQRLNESVFNCTNEIGNSFLNSIGVLNNRYFERFCFVPFENKIPNNYDDIEICFSDNLGGYYHTGCRLSDIVKLIDKDEIKVKIQEKIMEYYRKENDLEKLLFGFCLCEDVAIIFIGVTSMDFYY